jgi:hypothetical protein
MGMEDFQFLLGDLAVAFREDALWGDRAFPGRFRIDAFEAPLGAIEPGLGVVQTWFYCDRAIVPKPWPQLGDHLVIRDQLWEIVQCDEDDIGELGFRLIKEELGIRSVTSEGVVSGGARRAAPAGPEDGPEPGALTREAAVRYLVTTLRREPGMLSYSYKAFARDVARLTGEDPVKTRGFSRDALRALVHKVRDQRD